MTESSDPDVASAVGFVKDNATDQKLDDAARVAGTLLNDVDGYWLAQVIDDVRGGSAARSFDPAGYTLETSRVIHFRSEAVTHNLARAGSEHHRTFELPAGSRVNKVKGSGFADWECCIDNGQSDENRRWLLLRYNDDHVLTLHLDRWSDEHGPSERRRSTKSRSWSNGSRPGRTY